MRKKCASGVDVKQILRQTRAKNFQFENSKFRKSGAPRAQRLRALGQRALRMLKNVAEVKPESKMRSDPKRRAFGVEITQRLRQNRAKELQNFRKFSARRAHKKLRALGLRALKLA